MVTNRSEFSVYMPIIGINSPEGQVLFAEYVDRKVVPIAFEVCWDKSGTEIDDCVATMIQTDRPELLLNYLRSIGRHD